MTEAGQAREVGRGTDRRQCLVRPNAHLRTVVAHASASSRMTSSSVAFNLPRRGPPTRDLFLLIVQRVDQAFLDLRRQSAKPADGFRRFTPHIGIPSMEAIQQLWQCLGGLRTAVGQFPDRGNAGRRCPGTQLVDQLPNRSRFGLRRAPGGFEQRFTTAPQISQAGLKMDLRIGMQVSWPIRSNLAASMGEHASA